MTEERKEPHMVNRRKWAIVAVAGLMATSVLAAQQPAKKVKVPNAPYLKLAEPWPDAEVMQRRKVEAESRPLFAGDVPLILTLKADFKAINKERTENSTRRYPGTFSAGGDSSSSIPVELGSRGHSRLRVGTCAWVPLRVQFKKKDVAGTVFDGQSSLKLVTHCRDNDDFEQHVLREYVPYRIYGLLSPIAFRARLAKITYMDAASGKPLTTRYGMFIEDDGDVARRAMARAVELPRTVFKDLDPESLMSMTLFEYMISNTDVSIYKLHNVKLMVTEERTTYPVPYDFDFSGLVDTPYASPDPKLGIATVRDRIYRGPCGSEAEFDRVLEKFRAKKAEVMALYDSVPDLSAGYRKQARSYLESFYSGTDRSRVKKTLVDGCVRAPAM
jgi:hypothetical protein